MSAKIQQFLVLIATVGLLIFNYLSATDALGYATMSAISDKYATNITAAGYAFSIWGLIYLGMTAFSIYQVLPSQIERLKGIRPIYILNCVLNCAWLYLWSHEFILVCAAIIFGLLGTLAVINAKLERTENNADYWLVKVPFGIYFGWVTAAAILNATIGLVYLGVKFSDPLTQAVGAGLIFAAAALAVIIRFKLKNYFYPLAIAWALTAIAVKQSGQTTIVAACAVAVIICLIMTVSFVMEMPTFDYE